MAEEKELLEALAAQGNPIAAGELAKQVNSKVETVSTQLKRLKGKGLVTSGEDGWSITDTATEALAKGKLPGTSMMEEEVMPYDAFCGIGRRIGVNENRVKLVADMVFSGDYGDLKWVWDALGQQGLRNDVKSLWFNNWRVVVRKPVPPEIAEEVFLSKTEAEGKPKAKAEGEKADRDYILVDDMPVRVGQGVGDFDLETAKQLAGIRALKDRLGKAIPGTSAGAPPTMMGGLPELITALAAFREKPDQEGVNALIKELSDVKFDALKQDIISRIPRQQEPQSFMQQLTEFTTSMKEMGPILRSILGVPETGQQAQSPMTPIQLNDKNGNPMIMDIHSFTTLRKFESEERRADEKHKDDQEMAGVVKEFLSKISTAAARMAQR